MTTPAERAERAKVDRWIADWNAKQILAYDERVNRREERDKKWEERDGHGLPEEVRKSFAKYKFGEHIRDRFPVGAFFDFIEFRHQDDRKVSAEQLLVVAEVGRELLYAAICTADDDDNDGFFARAYSYWGPTVDNVLQECDREYRNSSTLLP